MQANLLTGLAVTGIFLCACTIEPPGPSYSQNETGRAFDVVYGEVLDVRVVSIEGNPGLIGTWGGASVGRAIGVTSSSRRNTRILAGAAGGIAGAVAGRAIERKLREDEALEITIQIDGAGAIAVVQADDLDFNPGDRVRVLRSRDGRARVQTL